MKAVEYSIIIHDALTFLIIRSANTAGYELFSIQKGK